VWERCGSRIRRCRRRGCNAGRVRVRTVYLYDAANLRSDQPFFVPSAIFLKGVVSRREVLPLIAEHLDQSTVRSTTTRQQDFLGQEQSPAATEIAVTTSQTPLDTCPKSLEDPALLSHLAQQDANIKKLFGNLDLLQWRMLALEKFMIGARTNSGSFPTDGAKHGQDLTIDSFEPTIGAGQSARSVTATVEDLRLGSEQLKQELNSIAAYVAKEGSPKATLDKALGSPSTAPSLTAKKKKSYTRRKPPTSRSSTTTAATGVVASGTHFASVDVQDDSSQIGSLAALREITTAMAQAPSICQTAISSNDLVHYGSGTECDYKAENGSPDVELTSTNRSDTTRSQPNKRRRTSGKEMSGDDAATSVYGKNEVADVAGLTSMGNHSEQQHLDSGSLILQEAVTRPSVVTLLQHAANTCQIANTELMIDPALRSTRTPTCQTLAEPGVLSSIENLPDQPRSKQTSQHPSNNGAPKYDSDQERRIKEYKARDALRKRKARAASTGKKKMVGEEKFKQEEKIRARDRMVKELMEREEMLENEGDL
jgi:hypothetical protein